MITFFIGTDIKKREEALEEALKKEGLHDADVALHTFDDTNWDRGAFENALGGNSFFEERKGFILKGLLGRADTLADFKDLKETLLESSQSIFVVENSVLKDVSKLFDKKKGVDFFTFDLAVSKKKESAQLFPTATAFVRGDKKGAWVGLQMLEREGVAAEEFLWPLVWKVKDALAKAPPGGDAFNKLAHLSRDLVVAYHESKRGGPSLASSFEQIVLGL